MLICITDIEWRVQNVCYIIWQSYSHYINYLANKLWAIQCLQIFKNTKDEWTLLIESLVPRKMYWIYRMHIDFLYSWTRQEMGGECLHWCLRNLLIPNKIFSRSQLHTSLCWKQNTIIDLAAGCLHQRVGMCCPMLDQHWSSVADVGPMLIQHWPAIVCFMSTTSADQKMRKMWLTIRSVVCQSRINALIIL